MKGKVLFVVGLGVGYVLGTRAGRQRYEQIKSVAVKVWDSPTVQKQVHNAQGFAPDRIGDLGTLVTENVKRAVTRSGGSKSGSSKSGSSRSASNASSTTRAESADARSDTSGASKPSSSKSSKAKSSADASGSSGTASATSKSGGSGKGSAGTGGRAS